MEIRPNLESNLFHCGQISDFFCFVICFSFAILESVLHLLKQNFLRIENTQAVPQPRRLCLPRAAPSSALLQAPPLPSHISVLFYFCFRSQSLYQLCKVSWEVYSKHSIKIILMIIVYSVCVLR